MINQKTIEVKISSSNMSYWRELGYSFENPAPRWGIIPKIEVKIEHLQEGSNLKVQCICDNCEKEYVCRYNRNTSICNSCSRSKSMLGNTLGKANKGKKLPHVGGENHPRWNPNKDEYAKYRSMVMQITRLQPIHTLKNSDKKRGLCGVKGAWQLDHVISIKEGFDKGIDPKDIGDISNLQFLPWKENRTKSASSLATRTGVEFSEIVGRS